MKSPEMKKRRKIHDSRISHGNDPGVCYGLFFSMLLIISVMLSACAKQETPVQKKPQMLDDTVFSVNGEQVSIGEWNLYAQPVIEKTDVMYGKEIWDYKMDNEGRLFGEALQENIRDRIVNVKVVAGHAKELEVTLSEDERTEISIAVEEYLEKLTEEEMKEYGIDRETVEKVYTDNYLATKVYEHLTLNVNTETDETDVRHMILRYIMLPKTYEDREGNTCRYSKEEMDIKRETLEIMRNQTSENPNLSIKDLENENYVVTEIITDYAGLREKLPEKLAGIVFWLREGEVGDVMETDAALFLFECVKIEDEASTRAARVRIIEDREKKVFEDSFVKWKKDIIVENNPSIWKSITDSINANGAVTE